MLIPPEVFRKKGYKVWCRRRRYRLAAVSARTADCGLSTRRTASSALLPAPTKSPTPTLLLLPSVILSLRMLFMTSITIPFGGRALTTILRRMLLTGRATSGIIPSMTRRISPPAALIRTPVSPLLQRTAPAYRLSLTIPPAFRSLLLSSADAVQRPLLSYISPPAGRTAPSSAPSWLPRLPQLQQALSV